MSDYAKSHRRHEAVVAAVGLSAVERGVLHVLACYCGAQRPNVCWPSLTTIAAAAELSVSTVQRAMRRLESKDCGLISRARRSGWRSIAREIDWPKVERFGRPAAGEQTTSVTMTGLTGHHDQGPLVTMTGQGGHGDHLSLQDPGIGTTTAACGALPAEDEDALRVVAAFHLHRHQVARHVPQRGEVATARRLLGEFGTLDELLAAMPAACRKLRHEWELGAAFGAVVPFLERVLADQARVADRTPYRPPQRPASATAREGANEAAWRAADDAERDRCRAVASERYPALRGRDRLLELAAVGVAGETDAGE